MPRAPVKRETFIALRARRTAYQVASEIINPHVEISSVKCSGCGRDVPFGPGHAWYVRCPDCCTPTQLPPAALPLVPEDNFVDETWQATYYERGLHWTTCFLLGAVLAAFVLFAAVALTN